MQATKENILQYLGEIKSEFSSNGITVVALFGSYAKNTQTPYSDIDIAIGKQSDFLERHSAYSYFDTIAKLKELIGKKFHRNIDVFDIDSKSPFMESIKKEILYV
ncbi:Putative nucleotidyltransferase [Sulfurovum sp. enrichment culture clone C5]|uniref:Putative nucleotidyltransferase n=1 Tax=Sulfurovum sp. enrichment culture clone C5 TaxID=497650 RepID=A0A0S4XNQ7_9BACT|nr:Putative nucleotidyltransferase [Sulfurovum sp. enrichment culture clone C5]